MVGNNGGRHHKMRYRPNRPETLQKGIKGVQDFCLDL